MTKRPPNTPSFLHLIGGLLLFGWLAAQINPHTLNTDPLYYARLFCQGMMLVAGFKLAWRAIGVVTGLLKRRSILKHASTNHGDAAWASVADNKRNGHYNTKGIFMGCCAHTGKPLFFEGETHGLTLSPAGGGKTVNMVIPALLHNGDLSMIVADLKGTLAVCTANARRKHHQHKTYCLNPARQFVERLGEPSRYNPLQILIDAWHRSPKDLIADAKSIALQLLPEPAQAGENGYFRNGSRKIIVFCLVYLAMQEEEGNLSQALALLQDDADLKQALYMASCSDALNGDLAGMAKDLLQKAEPLENARQWESFREGAIQPLEIFAASGWLADNTATCDFRFADLKRECATVYLMADSTKMDVYAPWLGLLGWCAMTELTRTKQTSQSVLFLLDEASNFKISGLPSKLTTMREYKLRCWFVLQEMAEFEQTYGKASGQTLLSQCQVKQYFNIAAGTADQLSKQLGTVTVKAENHGLGQNITDPVQRSISEMSKPLLSPQQARQFPDSIVLIDGQPAIHALKTGYHEAKPWVNWAEPNPYHGNKRFKGKTKVTLKY